MATRLARAVPRGRRLGWVDLLIIVSVFVGVQIAIQTAAEPGARAPQLAGHLLGVLMILPYLVVRRWPVTANYLVGLALILYYAIGFRGFPPTLVLVAGLYVAAEHGRTRAVAPVPTFFMGAALIIGTREHHDLLGVVNNVVPHIALLVVAALLGALVRNRRILAAETAQRLRLAAEEHDREAARRVAEERLRIARELHDTVSHALATIAVQSGAGLHLLDTQPERAREALAAIRRTGRDTLEELRATLGLLRTGPHDGAAPVDRSAGLARLPALLDAVRSAGLSVSAEVDGVPDGATDGMVTGLRPEVDHAAYRILQEALTNVLRHAGPDATAEVTVCRTGEELTLTVHNDHAGRAPVAQRGGPPGGPPGHGLAGMRERAAALGGRVVAAPDGSGFRVSAHLPLAVTPPATDVTPRATDGAGS